MNYQAWHVKFVYVHLASISTHNVGYKILFVSQQILNNGRVQNIMLHVNRVSLEAAGTGYDSITSMWQRIYGM
jgi:hypothetical protein